MKTLNKGSQPKIELEYSSIPKVFFDTIKVGIIKSNLIAMLAGLCLALYVFDASFIANIVPIILSVIGSSLIIGAAGVFNNLYDRDIDAIMERTRTRPTVTGQVDTKSGLILGITITVLGGILLYIASPSAAVFGILGLLLYVFPYTMWTKRTTIYNTEVGSLSGAVPPLIGWAAISPELGHFEIWALVVTMLLWQMPHFYGIAIRRFDEYKAAGVPMLPVVKGIRRTYIQTNVYLVLLLLSSFLFWPLSPLVAIVAFLVSLAWLILSVATFDRNQTKKWSHKMFIFSINHITIVFLVIIAYSLIAQLLR
ncbi:MULTISPECIES: heme o synthase [Paenibacillus]|uniref:heme o synthase n=1 Tax=Paenibacillus TaxID=44249 RepID=UPI000FDA0667|nr:heme o synthase [Paenibacillus sp. CC-CFT742]MBE7678890.1 protoheme IX farnesyltransferase [Paenibacillus sp. P13VS]MBY0219045.1 protoheme IX farnesyltransferase [Paenibacillus illinoisensis]WJH29713.1 heme o synthase [Paenibacillus sp. CC-CFT742]